MHHIDEEDEDLHETQDQELKFKEAYNQRKKDG